MELSEGTWTLKVGFWLPLQPHSQRGLLPSAGRKEEYSQSIQFVGSKHL